MKSRIVYLAGPMNGVADYNRPAFNEAEKALKAQGYIVINPAMLPTKLPYDSYMPICLALMNAADTVCMLPGWKYSPGAKLEYRYAEYHGKPIYRYVEGEMADLIPEGVRDAE